MPDTPWTAEDRINELRDALEALLDAIDHQAHAYTGGRHTLAERFAFETWPEAVKHARAALAKANGGA